MPTPLTQTERDALDDHDVVLVLDDRVGLGPHALHNVEAVAG